MTNNDLIQAVQSHFGDQTAQFRTRITNKIPEALEMFASEHQWEFLDKHTTTTAETDSGTSKDKITLPADFWKPVRFYTTSYVLEYIDRAEWSERQRSTLPSGEPRAYTVIGPDFFLDRTSDGSTINVVYSRRISGMSLSDIPEEYHYAIMAAVVWLLTPGYVTGANGAIRNTAWRHAEELYQGRVRHALASESQSKGRTRHLTLPVHMRMRGDYR
jgi:hypothetical protein